MVVRATCQTGCIRNRSIHAETWAVHRLPATSCGDNSSAIAKLNRDDKKSSSSYTSARTICCARSNPLVIGGLFTVPQTPMLLTLPNSTYHVGHQPDKFQHSVAECLFVPGRTVTQQHASLAEIPLHGRCWHRVLHARPLQQHAPTRRGRLDSVEGSCR